MLFDVLRDEIKMDMTEVYEGRYLGSNGNIKTSPNQQPQRAKEWRRERDSASNAFPRVIMGETGGWGAELGVAFEWDENHEHYKKKRRKGGLWANRMEEESMSGRCHWFHSIILTYCLKKLLMCDLKRERNKMKTGINKALAVRFQKNVN